MPVFINNIGIAIIGRGFDSRRLHMEYYKERIHRLKLYMGLWKKSIIYMPHKQRQEAASVLQAYAREITAFDFNPYADTSEEYLQSIYDSHKETT